MITKKYTKDVPHTVAEELYKNITALRQTQSEVHIGLVGGRTIASICDILVTYDIEWKHIHLYMIDERLVPLDDSQSNFSIIQKHLCVPLGPKLPATNVHPFEYKADLPDFGVKEYESIVLGAQSALDIALVSVGGDGHIASLFPNHHSIKNDSIGYFSFDDSPKEPPHRMSISRKLFLQTKQVIGIVKGEEKKSALQNIFNDELTIYECPAKLIRYIPES
ncbi:MAG: 6-phosphogluconolactonase, partial [Candidatus Woesearchaeota archaeon]